MSEILSKDILKTLEALWKLEKIILDTLDFNQVVQDVVDSILLELGYLELGYRVVVLALLDESGKNVKRVALSQTEEAKKTREVSEVPFEDIVIPMTAKNNLCVKAITDNYPQVTHYFPDILTPPLSKENALESQHNAGIKTSMVYPLVVRGNVIGVMIFSMIKNEDEVTMEERVLIQYFTDLAALAVQNARIYRDLENRKKKLEQVNLRLKQTDKAKDEFISIVSHELKTPMSIVKSYLWMLTSGRGGKLTKKQEEYLEKASSGTERMINLINDMLSISRMQQGRLEFRLEYVDLYKMINEVTQEISPKIEEKGLKLKRNVKKVRRAYSDSGKVREILLNLISNAYKYTEKGTITVNLTRENKDFVKVEVTDTGRGISEDEAKKLFNKFQRLDNSYQTVAKAGGTGLGLYIVKLYITELGGKINLISEGLGKGSTFEVLIPVKKELVKAKVIPKDSGHH